MSFEQELIATQPKLLGYARSLTKNVDAAHDLVQTVMMRALINKERFTMGTNMMAWTTTILRNEFYTLTRKKYREVQDTDDNFTNSLVQIPDQNPHMQHEEFKVVFNTVPKEQREAIELIAISGFSYEEAAKVLKVPEGTVKSRVSRGRKLLVDKMGKDFISDQITLGVIGHNEYHRTNHR